MKLSDSISVLPARYREKIEKGANADKCAEVLSDYILEIEAKNMRFKCELEYLYGQDKIPSLYKQRIYEALQDYFK